MAKRDLSSQSQRVVSSTKCNNMGEKVFTCLSLLISVLAIGSCLALPLEPVKGLFVQPTEKIIEGSGTAYQPYRVVPFTQTDAINVPLPSITRNAPVIEIQAVDANSVEDDKGFASDSELRNKDLFSDTTGYQQYQSRTSFNLAGPSQMETIETKSYHKEVEPYDTDDYSKHHHHGEEEHAEVHYHQHKHLHKHQHKQEHTHKHKEDHKHEHGHKHHHENHHEHKHHQEHKHQHHNEHKHEHHNHHEHKHHQEHKHDHHHGHEHGHKHVEEHQHKQDHKHKHEHLSDHKHKHWNDHKHEHHHGHKHMNEHKHDHKHHNNHEHKHGHGHDHKHQHHESNHHNHHKNHW